MRYTLGAFHGILMVIYFALDARTYTSDYVDYGVEQNLETFRQKAEDFACIPGPQGTNTSFAGNVGMNRMLKVCSGDYLSRGWL